MSNFESQYYESDHWWQPGMVEDLANITRLEKTCDLIPSDALRILDVGCGNGVFARMLKSVRPELHITCTDRSSAALRYAQADELVQSEITGLPFMDDAFDCVTCLEVIEHLTAPDFPKAISELARVAKRYLVIGVPYDEAIERNMSTCPACFTKFNSDLHLRRFTLPYFKQLFEEHGFFLTSHLFPVPQRHYFGFRSYYALRRWLSGESRRTKFASICPICGLLPVSSNSGGDQSDPSSSRSIVDGKSPPSQLKQLVKHLWPRQVTSGYWIVGLFTISN